MKTIKIIPVGKAPEIMPRLKFGYFMMPVVFLGALYLTLVAIWDGDIEIILWSLLGVIFFGGFSFLLFFWEREYKPRTYSFFYIKDKEKASRNMKISAIVGAIASLIFCLVTESWGSPLAI